MPTLVGGVTDQSGAAVAQASVTVTNIATGVQTATKANNEGNFVVPFLLPGNYEITVTAPGFKAFSRSPIELRVNDRASVDVRLEIGQATEKVTVIAEAPLLEANSSNRGQVIDSATINGLPLNGHNPFTLTW